LDEITEYKVMNKEYLTTDVYMTTEHKRKQVKSKVSFSMVMNKVLVGAILLNTLASGTTPAYVDDISDKFNNAVNNYNSSVNITNNYEVSIESTIFNVKLAIETIELMKSKGEVTQEALSKLATEVLQLEQAVNQSGSKTSKEVVDIVLRA